MDYRKMAKEIDREINMALVHFIKAKMVVSEMKKMRLKEIGNFKREKYGN